MNHSTGFESILDEIKPGRIYGNSILRAARHFYSLREDRGTLTLADELQRRPDIWVVTVLDSGGRPKGLIRRERLFALLGKPFGREILGRTLVSELAEASPFLEAHAGLFAVAEGVLADATDNPYRLLVDEEGRFRGALATRDLADYLSRITQDDIELAGRIQERLEECVDRLGDRRFSFDAWSRAAKGVGGDFWFTKRLADDRVFLALCDVCGKGVSASLVVSLVWGMLLMYDFRLGLGPLLERLNESLVATFRMERYLTGFFAIYDPVSRELEAADMGHSHALLFRGGGVLRLKSKAGNLPVGVDAAMSPIIERWPLFAGDFLFIFSDGLVEQENASGVEFGEGRLAASIAKALSGSEPVKAFIPLCLEEYRGRIPQQDDMSFMYLELTAPLCGETEVNPR